MTTFKQLTNLGEVTTMKQLKNVFEEIYWVDCGNGLMEGGTDKWSRRFGKTSTEWEALQKYDLDRDPQFMEKLSRDMEEFYASLGETPEEKEKRKIREKEESERYNSTFLIKE